MVSLWLFAAVLIPLSLIIGVAAATISFTSWSIIVPLLFVGFDFGLYESLYFAIVVDLVDGLILVGVYATQKKIGYKTALIWAGPMVIAEILGFILLNETVSSHTELLRGGVGFLVIGVASLFLYKGFQGSRKGEKFQRNGWMRESPMEFEHTQEEGTLTASTKKGKLSQESRFSRLLDNYDSKVTRGLRIFVLLLGIIVSGVIGGFLGVGAGMNYTILFLLLLEFDLLKATGTGSLMMSIAMVVAAVEFYNYVSIAVIWRPLVVTVCFAAMGTAIGAKWAFRLSRSKLNFLVGGALLATGIISTLQGLILA